MPGDTHLEIKPSEDTKNWWLSKSGQWLLLYEGRGFGDGLQRFLPWPRFYLYSWWKAENCAFGEIKCFYKQEVKEEKGVKTIEEKATLVALKTEEGAMGQGRPGLLLWKLKSQGWGLSPESLPPEGAWPCGYINLVKLIMDCWPPELQENKHVWFKATMLWQFVTASVGN